LISGTAWRDGGQVEISQVVAYLSAMIQKVFTVAGWLALAFIVYATLCPIADRPVLAGPQFEHFAAFAFFGLAFGLAYPRRLPLVIALVLGSAFALEILQELTPDRHARLLDAMVKAAGGICGIGISQLGTLLLRTQIGRVG
jgi:VanZ family protein